VFGPYAQDDEFGSRAINPMELYHNQVTRVQGAFSLRMFHRSWGLMLIQANLDAPCTLLDFPTRQRFIDEICSTPYDIIGIGSITTNVLKVREMCRLIRAHRPKAKIVVGGHVANIPDLDQRIDTDFIVRGEGVRWFRELLGEDTEAPIRHPCIPTRAGTRSMGVTVSEDPHDITATLIPSVGCPVGCNFCATSAMFGGKGRFINFYETGDELFDVMCQLERDMQARSFFVMDENFLMDRRRALRLLELMQRDDKSWILYIFSSGRVISSYTMEQLVGLGISWVWMGLEGENSRYSKLSGLDTRTLVRRLQSHGIRVLGSTIIGLEDHTPENIDLVIDYAVSHDTDFHQFMLYTPLPGTPLHDELTAQGRMKAETECPTPDTHGQFIFNYHHPHITDGRETEYVLRAFRRDLEVNGPSIVRVVRTTLAGWQRYKNHPDPRIRRRFEWGNAGMATTYAAMVAATRRYYRRDPAMRAKVSGLLGDLFGEFGWASRLFAAVGGPFVHWTVRREQRRLSRGWTYEPPTFYEHNAAAHGLGDDRRGGKLLAHVTPRVPAPQGKNARADVPVREVTEVPVATPVDV
jgi:hypothetical protein